MNNEDNNSIIQKESSKIFSTPKFIKSHKDKEYLSNNNSKNYDISSFDESKNEKKQINSKNIQQSLVNNEEIKESNEEILFKENFSLLSLFNNSCSNKINIDKNKEQNDKALISFCDKSENNSFNNEIIFKDKNNSSIFTNKDKEKEENLKIDSSFNKGVENTNLIKEKNNIDLGGNTNLNLNKEKYNENEINSIEINNCNQKQNDSSSFNYHLPLEKDKVPEISGFIEDNNSEIFNKIVKINKSLDLENHNLDLKKININIKLNKLNIKKNNILSKKYNITYSKKKVKRNNTEKLNRTFKNSPMVTKNNNFYNEIRKNKSLIEKGINKITIKKNILHSCGNYNKIKKKIKNVDFNTSKEENIEKENERVNFNTISPKKKLRIIINKTKINLNIESDNLNSINNFNNCFSKEKFSKMHKNLDKNNINLSNKILIENNTNYRKKNYSSFSTNQKKYKNRKLIKSSFEFNNTLYNFKTKKLQGNIETNLNNTKELNDNNQDMNISDREKNKKNFGIYTKSNKKILNNKKFNNNRTRNISNLYSNKIFNGIKGLLKNNNIIFNTINYSNNESKNHIKRKNFLHNKINPKIEIKSSLLPIKQALNKKFKFSNKILNKNIKHFYSKNNNNCNNNAQNNANYLSKKDKSKIKFHNKDNKFNNRKTINNIIHKPNNLVYNHEESTYKNIIDNIIDYNTFSHSNTDRSINRNNILSNKAKNNFFVNINCSANSLKRNKIKVNTANKHNKIAIFPAVSSHINKKNNYWKIYKKPKNCCLLNKFSNDFNKTEYNTNYDKINIGNSQFIKFKENKVINNFIEENNSSSITNDYFNSQKTDFSNTITNNNLNIDQINQELNSTQPMSHNKIYQNSNKINKKNNSCYRNKSNEIREILSNKFSINEDIIKLSILRNNLNNQIIKEFSVVVGDENNKNKNIKEIKSFENKEINNNRENSLANENKKTIINVNQYYPSYFIK